MLILLFKPNYVFNEYYAVDVDTSFHGDAKNIVKHVFNEESKEFFTIAYDESKNKCLVYHNHFDARLMKWNFEQLSLDLKSLGITAEPLTPNDHIGMTSKSNLIVIIRGTWIFYADFRHNTLVFKNDLSDTQTSVDLSTRFDFEPIQGTNDLIGLDKTFKRLVYLNLYNDEPASSPISLKLKLFTNKYEDMDIMNFKVKKNFLLTLQRHTRKLVVYDLNRVKQASSFSDEAILFENVFHDKNLFFEMSIYCNYLIIFQNPRRLLVYRLNDFVLVAEVPLLIRVKEVVSNKHFTTLILSNNDLLTLMIVDPIKDHDWATAQTNSLKLRYINE